MLNGSGVQINKLYSQLALHLPKLALPSLLPFITNLSSGHLGLNLTSGLVLTVSTELTRLLLLTLTPQHVQRMMTAVEITVVALIRISQQVETHLSLSPLNVAIERYQTIQSTTMHIQQVQGSLPRPHYQSTQLANRPLLNRDLSLTITVVIPTITDKVVLIPQVTPLRILLGVEMVVVMDFRSITQQIILPPTHIVMDLDSISKVV